MQPQQNQYDFILDPKNNSKGPQLLQNPKNKIIVSVIFVMVVLIIIIIGINIITSIGKQSNDDILEVYAYQTEIIRVSELGLDSINDPTLRGQVATLSSFIKTDSSNTRSFLSKNGVELKPELVASKKNTSLDEELERASAINRFDEIFSKELDELIASYKSSLRLSAQAGSTPARENVIVSSSKNIVTYEGTIQN